MKLSWWSNNSCSIGKNSSLKIISTDASTTVCGGTNGLREIRGFWNEDQRKLRLNYSEMSDVKIILFELGQGWQNCQILLRIR